MTTEEIIAKFNLQVDDASELSSEEELDLANDVYTDVANDRDWEWLKKTFTGVTSASVPYIALPADFKKVMPNYAVDNYGDMSVVFVGAEFSTYKIIPFSSRRDYRNQDGFCYIDIPNQRLVFTLQPTSAKAVEYDYVSIPEALVIDESPIFRSAFHKIISFGMAMKFPSIEQANKATSYANENTREYMKILSDMAVEDANIKLSI